MIIITGCRPCCATDLKTCVSGASMTFCMFWSTPPHGQSESDDCCGTCGLSELVLAVTRSPWLSVLACFVLHDAVQVHPHPCRCQGASPSGLSATPLCHLSPQRHTQGKEGEGPGVLGTIREAPSPLGIQGGKRSRPRRCSKATMAGSFPNLGKDSIQEQESQRSPTESQQRGAHQTRHHITDHRRPQRNMGQW